MDKAQKQAALNTALIIGSIAAVIVAMRVLIELFSVQVFGIVMVSVLLVFLIKTMYENEVDKIRTLDRLNNKEAK